LTCNILLIYIYILKNLLVKSKYFFILKNKLIQWDLCNGRKMSKRRPAWFSRSPIPQVPVEISKKQKQRASERERERYCCHGRSKGSSEARIAGEIQGRNPI